MNAETLMRQAPGLTYRQLDYWTLSGYLLPEPGRSPGPGNCRRTFTAVRGRNAEQAARMAGWVVWEGNTLGGDHVHRVYCTTCAGRSNDSPDQQPRWDARCSTCDWSASQEDWYDEEPFTADDAAMWRQDHHCEPDVVLIPPEQITRERAGAQALERAQQRIGAA